MPALQRSESEQKADKMWRRSLIVPEYMARILALPFAVGLFIFGELEKWLHKTRTGRSGDMYPGL